jgi:hypothetical protein
VSTAESHAFVAEYNWDDGLDPIAALVDDPQTDFATALMIFWRLDGPFFHSDSPVTAAAAHLNARVRANLTSDFYANRNLSYDPVADNGLSRVQLHKLRADGVESVLMDAV